jgi:hypothetical protein
VKLYELNEPYLEFGNGSHLCPRAGIATYDVYDTRVKARREQVFIGAVGTSNNLIKLASWLELCKSPISPKPDAGQPNLFPGFCGFNRQYGFKAEFNHSSEISRTLNNSEIRKIIKITKMRERIESAVELYFNEMRFLTENRNVDVIVCVIPTELYEKIAFEEVGPVEDTIEDKESEEYYEVNFRRLLKAKTMQLSKPIQIIRELSLDMNPKTQQDDATRAWNFCTAVYYKASQTVPWKMVSNVNRPSVCYVGIGFYRSRDRKILNTSLAQIFDELGNGVILRGTEVVDDKIDRIPHLTANQAFDLLSKALEEYHFAMGNYPGRLVVHKSSNYKVDEIDGFRQATESVRINTTDFVTVLDTEFRLLRDGSYPPYRGTCVELDKTSTLLFTRGSVRYYKTYPGAFIPQPIEVRIIESDESSEVICNEILALTKMNWNNTQFDGKYPITLSCAKKVGQIMKYVDGEPQRRYSYYM